MTRRRKLFTGILTVLFLLAGAALQAGMGDGEQSVTAAGTAEALSATSVECIWVIITAKAANTGSVYFGGSTVDATRGTPLLPGESAGIPGITPYNLYDLALIYVDAAVNGEGVTFTYFSR